jgi:1,4-dihydroxy-2-naphthoyl-CoA synthase
MKGEMGGETMEEFGTIMMEKKKGIAIITLRFADILNDLEARIKRELLVALKNSGEDKEVQLVVLSTGGRDSPPEEFLKCLKIFEGNFWSAKGGLLTKPFIAL